MFEATVSVEKCNKRFVDYVADKLDGVLENIDGVLATEQSKFRSYLTVACKDDYGQVLESVLLDLVADTIALGYKNVFIRQNVANVGNTLACKTLVNVMCALDSEFDKQIIKSVVGSAKNVSLDGYYNFSLGKLKRKWRDIVNLTTESGVFASGYGDDGLIDFLKFMMETVQPSTGKISVSMRNKLLIYDSDDKLVQLLNPLSVDTSAEEFALVNAVLLHPKSVVLYADKPQKDFVNVLERLFELKIVKNS